MNHAQAIELEAHPLARYADLKGGTEVRNTLIIAGLSLAGCSMGSLTDAEVVKRHLVTLSDLRCDQTKIKSEYECFVVSVGVLVREEYYPHDFVCQAPTLDPPRRENMATVTRYCAARFISSLMYFLLSDSKEWTDSLTSYEFSKNIGTEKTNYCIGAGYADCAESDPPVKATNVRFDNGEIITIVFRIEDR